VPDFDSEAVTKFRVGAAAELDTRPFGLKGELSAGRDDGTSVAGAMLKAAYVPPSFQVLTVEVQGRAWSGDLDESHALVSSVIIGASYELTRSWACRAYLIHGLSDSAEADNTSVVFQAYYFGG
jgi:hypothetical protein